MSGSRMAIGHKSNFDIVLNIIGNITKVGRYLEYHSIIYLICYQDAQV